MTLSPPQTGAPPVAPVARLSSQSPILAVPVVCDTLLPSQQYGIPRSTHLRVGEGERVPLGGGYRATCAG